ncbi:MAG: hypothetical protein SGBAC_004229 [Bacillariaceae sp.]
MGKEYTIDVRLWLPVLALAFCLGRMDIFGGIIHVRLAGNNDSLLPFSVSPPLPKTATKKVLNSNTEPSSQHFALDFKGARADFLKSKDQLIQAIANVSNDNKTLTTGTDTMMKLQTVSCQDLQSPPPTSISCLAVLDQGQISIHSWPANNALSVDVIRYGSTSILPLVSKLKEAFGANYVDDDDSNDAASFWSLDYRGQALENRYVESYWEVTNTMISKVKDIVLQEEWSGKQLEIWDLLDIDISVRYEDAIAHNLQPEDPRWINNELARPSRVAYLDGHSIVTTDPEIALFQEVFVHPALLSHENPKKIAILGGPGSIIHETLKSNTIDSITWLQPDEHLIHRIQEFFPKTFDCSDLEGRTDNCLEDSTLAWVQQDAKVYFGGKNDMNDDDDDDDDAGLDVIFSRVEKPQDADDLSSYVGSVMQALSPDGVLMLSLGQAPTVLHPRGDVGHFAGYEKLFQTLERLDDVASMTVFEEDFTLSGFSSEMVPHAFMLVCKSAKCRQRFRSNPELIIERELPERYSLRPNNNNNKPSSTISTSSTTTSTLEYYDGAVHSRLQVPPKAYETIYCRREPMPIECTYRSLDFSKPLFEFDTTSTDQSAFEVIKDDNARVVAKVDIPKGSYIMAKDLSRSLLVGESEAALENVSYKEQGDMASLGRLSSLLQDGGSRVFEMGVPGLIRTTTKSTTTTTEESAEAASNVGCWFCPEDRPKYSPVYDRHLESFHLFLVATQAISSGEELVRLV